MSSAGIFKSSVIYIVSGTLPMLSGLILLPFYANLLTSELFGILTVYISFTFLIQTLVNYGLDYYVGVHYFDLKESPEQLRKLIGTVSLLLLLIGAGISFLSLITGDTLFHLFFRAKNITFFPFGFMSVATAIFNSYFKTYTNLLINQKRAVRFFWLNMFNFCVTLIISIVGLYWFPHSLIGPMWGRLLSGVLIFAVAFLFIHKEFGSSLDWSFFPGIRKFCTPILIFALLNWVLSYYDRFIIVNQMTENDVAIYDFAVKALIFLEFLQMGLVSSITPHIFDRWKSGPEQYNSPEVGNFYAAFNLVTGVVTPIIIVLIPLLVPLIIYNKDYYEAFTFIGIIGAGYMLKGLYIQLYNPILYFKRTKVLPKILLISAVFQIAATFFLVRHFGIIGAAWASLLSKPVQILLIYAESRRFFTFEIDRLKMIYFPLIYMLMVVLFQYFITKDNYPSFYTAQLLITLILVLAVYRPELKVVRKLFFEMIAKK